MNKRPKIQFSLLACICAILMAAIVIGLNSRMTSKVRRAYNVQLERHGQEIDLPAIDIDEAMLDPRVKEILFHELGLHSTTFDWRFQGWPATHRIFWSDATGYDKSLSGSKWYLGSLLINIFTALAIIISPSLVCEMLVRRRDGRSAFYTWIKRRFATYSRKCT